MSLAARSSLAFPSALTTTLLVVLIGAILGATGRGLARPMAERLGTKKRKRRTPARPTVTLRRLDLAAEIYHLREPQKIPCPTIYAVSVIENRPVVFGCRNKRSRWTPVRGCSNEKNA